MLKFILFFIVLLISLRSEAAIIKGQINDFKNKKVIAFYSNYLSANVINHEFKTDKDGKFEFIVSIDHPEIVTIGWKGGGLKLYIEPADTVDFIIDSQENIHFNNSNGRNNFFFKEIQKNWSDKEMTSLIINSDPRAFYENLIKREEKAKVELNELELQYEISPSFKEWITKYVTTRRYYEVMRYFRNNNEAFNQPELFNSYYDEFSNLLKDEDYIKHKNVKDALSDFIYAKYLIEKKKAGIPLSQGDSKFVPTIFKLANESLKGAFLKYYRANLLLDLSDNTNEYVYKELDKFLLDHSDGHFSDILRKRFKIAEEQEQKYRSLQVFKADILDAQLLTDEGDTIAFQDVIFNNVVYIDFWATWCKPCLRKIPDLNTLNKEIQVSDLEVKIVTLSVDDEYSRWRKFLLENEDSFKNFKNYYVINSFDSQILNTYNIKGIPRYWIIDSECKLVDYKAPDPTDKNLQQTFRNLNK
ncbi:MAG: TlpA family protein disulfide reductase [Candidatus Cyclobacteriaceae bacterium M2_1C_046]